jgi:outer membrane protein assembly factor BamB
MESNMIGQTFFLAVQHDENRVKRSVSQYFCFASAILWVLTAASISLAFEQWPQFQGPSRDSHATAQGLITQWPEQGPPLNWTFRNCGLGYSSPSIVDGSLLITGARENREVLICLDVDSGNEQWASDIGPVFDFEGNTWGAGPRSAPTIHNDLVYALGGSGNLICAELATGDVRWSKHMMEDLNGQVNPIGGGPGTKPGEPKIGWGYSWAPLITEGKLVCFPGGPSGALAALDPVSGDLLWRSSEFTAQASYASPVAAVFDEVPQVIALHNEGLTSVHAEDGQLLWEWQKSYSDVVIPTPIVTDGHVYVSAGSSPSTCALVHVKREEGNFVAEMLYTGKAIRVMKNQVGGSVIVAGHAYGYSDKVGWICQEVSSGEQKWAARQPLKAGSVIAAENLLYCYDEDMASVALIEANPEKFVLRSQFQLPEQTQYRSPSGRNWTPPVIANGRLYIRDQELLFSFNIRQ